VSNIHSPLRVERFRTHLLITPASSPTLGDNINAYSAEAGHPFRGSWPGIPREAGHPFHGKPATLASERSDAG
jgi:hypothetical protein